MNPETPQTAQLWWHVYRGVLPNACVDGGSATLTTTLGEAKSTPEQAPPVIPSGFVRTPDDEWRDDEPVLLEGDAYMLRYVASFDHEPDDEEVDAAHDRRIVVARPPEREVG